MLRFLLVTVLALAALPAARAENASPDKATLPGPFGPPSWDTQYPAKERFLVLDQFNDEAVLDRETGLVWQRAVPNGTALWAGAIENCALQIVGNRRGWRLPTFEEMSTLIDAKHANPALPPNNPFTNFAPTDLFWTSTTRASETAAAWLVLVDSPTHFLGAFKANINARFWCVRGGQGTQNRSERVAMPAPPNVGARASAPRRETDAREVRLESGGIGHDRPDIIVRTYEHPIAAREIVGGAEMPVRVDRVAARADDVAMDIAMRGDRVAIRLVADQSPVRSLVEIEQTQCLSGGAA